MLKYILIFMAGLMLGAEEIYSEEYGIHWEPILITFSILSVIYLFVNFVSSMTFQDDDIGKPSGGPTKINK